MILLWYSILFVTAVICQDFLDIILLVDVGNNSTNYTCVAGSTADGTAISFITVNSANYSNHLTVSKYVVNGIEYTDEYSCDFEIGSSCENKWNDIGSVKSSEELVYDLSPVLDERWESMSSCNLISNSHMLNSINTNIGISIRTNGIVSILLCNEEMPPKCYYMTLENKKIVFLRYCTEGKMEEFVAEDSSCSNVTIDNTQKITLTERKWHNFFLSQSVENDNNILKLNGIGRRVEYMQLKIPKNESMGTLGKMYLYADNTRTKVLWKIHKYRYLSLNENVGKGEWHDFGPELTPKNKTLCVALYAAVCEKCSLSFKFNSDESEIKGITKKSKQWQYMKIVLSNTTLNKYKLQVKVSVESSYYGEFWFIDDIRSCHVDETRIINITTPVNKDKISCVTLKQKSSVSNTVGEVGTSEKEMCNDTTKIGQNCDIPCTSVLGLGSNNEYCNKHIICKQISNTSSKCYCASGYYGKNCKTPCPGGFYGSNCFKVCEPCEDSCLKSSGVCLSVHQCTPESTKQTCKLPALLQLLKPPIIINSTLTTITVQLDINENKENLKYQIQYTTDYTDWVSEGEKQLASKSKEITLTNLTSMTDYRIRVVLYDDDEQQDTVKYEHIYTTAKTDCDHPHGINIYKNLKVKTTPTEVTILWTPVCSGKLQFNTFYVKENLIACSLSAPYSDSESDSRNITDGVYTISNLIPNTEYGLQVKNADEEVDSESAKSVFTTKALPVLKKNPKILNSTLTTIAVQFDREDIIENKSADLFAIQYKQKNSPDGWWETSREKVGDVNIKVIENLQKETKYNIRVVFYTLNNDHYDACIPTVTVKTDCKDLLNTDFIKDFKVVPKENEATVFWTAVCRNKFQIKIKCHEKNERWCKDVYAPPYLNSLDNNYTINNLLPFTSYTIDFGVHDPQKDETRHEIQRTNPAAPPAVTKLQVYSSDKNAISVRFSKPYPPYGELSKYTLHIKECSAAHYNNYSTSSQTCEFWDGFECITIKQQFEESCYNITVAANNKDVEKTGEESLVSIDANKKTEAPPYVHINKTYNSFLISWNHPHYIRGILERFQITVHQTETLLLNQTPNHYFNESLDITTYSKEYSYELTGNLRMSSKYEISVQGITRDGTAGQQNTSVIITSPIKPKFLSNITPIHRGNTTQEITIPQCDLATLTNNSFMYVVVCDPSSVHHQPENRNIADPQKIKLLTTWSNCDGTFWVSSSSKLNVNREERKYTIGNETSSWKIPLRADVNYSVIVVLVNEYGGEYNYEKYSFITQAPVTPPSSQPELYALLLLLLILPVVGYFTYRKYRRSKAIPESGTSFEVVAAQNNNTTVRNLFNTLSRNLPIRKSQDFQHDYEHELPLMKSNISDIPEFSKLIKIGNFSQYVKESLENGELERQHGLFPKGATKPWEYGVAKENKFKNRYNNLTAYDHSRVILSKLHGDPFSDFINANYIDGYKTSKAYIATQGPKQTTVNDFWRMIWQENVKYIIMLANLIEGTKTKCEKYWPDLGTTQEYSNITVTFVKTDIYADYEYRILEAVCDGSTRKIQQLHFTSWPDHGVPQYPQSLVPYLKKILTIPATAPIVVHCSAGVGRTGTIILTDICLRMAAVEGQVDVLKYMHNIREQRANLVDNFDQYKLVHMLLLECLLAPKTNLPCENLAKAVDELTKQGGMQKQLNYLRDTAWHYKVMKSSVEIEAENVSKNRFPDIVPRGKRIYISRYPYDDEFSDYINAVPVDGFKIKDQFIVTQTPLPHTVKDFWRMIVENNVKVIVSLNEISLSDKTCGIFWPHENETPYTPVPYLTLHFQTVKEDPNHDIYNIQVENTSDGTETIVRIVQFKEWTREQVVPDRTEGLIRTLEEAQSLSRQGGPLVVTCYDGSMASGLFVALSFLIEKMKLEQICDVCQAVRAVRTNRMQFISHREQFEFLYESAIQYMISFDDYSNFEMPRKM